MRDDAADEREFLEAQGRTRKPAPTKRKPAEPFVRLPLWWAEAAAKATRDPGLLVLVELLHIHWKTRSTTFPLPNGRLQKLGVTRDVKRRVLYDLERAGLIAVGSDARRSATSFTSISRAAASFSP